MSARFEVHEAKDGTFYWLLRAKNGKVTASHETHRSVRDACRAADAVHNCLKETHGPDLDWEWIVRGDVAFWFPGGPRKGLRRYAALRAWRPA